MIWPFDRLIKAAGDQIAFDQPANGAPPTDAAGLHALVP